MKRLLILCLFLACSAAPGEKELPPEKKELSLEKKELPPGYGMMCNSDSSKFIATMPGGTRIYNGSVYNAFDNAQDATDRAWRQYNYSSPPPDSVDWRKCEANEVVGDNGTVGKKRLPVKTKTKRRKK